MPLNNFGVLEAGLYRSAQPDSKADFESVKALGVKVIYKVNGDGEFSVKDEVKHGFTVIHDVLQQWNPSVKQARNAAATVNDIVKARQHGILIHCTYGRDRTGFLCAAYRIIFNRWYYHKAVEEMAEYGSTGVFEHFNHEFREALRKIAHDEDLYYDIEKKETPSE